MTKEDLRFVKIWLGDNMDQKKKILKKAIEFSPNKSQWERDIDNNDIPAKYIYSYEGCNNMMWDSGKNNKIEFDKLSQKEITPSQLLGETEQWEPKVGEWVKIINTGFNVSGNRLHEVKKIAEFNIRNSMWYVVFENGSRGHGSYYENAGDYLLRCLSPARPEEIPQEEVGYVECVGNKGKSTYPLCSDLLIGKIYSTKDKTPWRSLGSWNEVLGDSCYGKNFKPSTREAYEAQKNNKYKGEWKVEQVKINVNIEWPDKEVNKCSTINTNQNECKNENKSIKVRGSGISISTVSRARGKSLCSSGGKISLGTYYSRNKQKPCNSKA